MVSLGTWQPTTTIQEQRWAKSEQGASAVDCLLALGHYLSDLALEL